MTPKGRRTREATPEPPPLTVRGLDLCDGCGAALAERHRLSGLCPACLSRTSKETGGEHERDHGGR